MAQKKPKKFNPAWYVVIVFFGLADLTLLLSFLMHDKNIALFDPKGPIAHEQFRLLLFVVGILLTVMIPALILLFYTAWKYRETNPKLKQRPSQKGKSFVAYVWLIPITTLIVLANTMIPATHRLAPQKSIASDAKPVTIQVISLRWKWLFIYPEQGIATVNFVQIPVDTPVQFEMTADETPMSSFWIPNLGGQLYTMTSHVNRLNLMADTIGDYPGSTPELNGAGFAGMRFTARVTDERTFNQWTQDVKQTTNILDAAAYDTLVQPSENSPVALYAGVANDLFDNVITKYEGSEGHTH